MGPNHRDSLSVFEQRFLSGKPQLHPILNALAGMLLCMWDFYDPLCANTIIAWTFEYLTTACIEPDIERLPLVRGTQRFSWFVRRRTGMAIAFAVGIFTKSTQIDMMEYIQAVPDMDFWTCLTNDILSSVSFFFVLPLRFILKPHFFARFHKEELAGETVNYVHTRAYIENKAPLQVLAEMAEELRVSRNTIHKALSHSPRALRSWKIFERGYV